MEPRVLRVERVFPNSFLQGRDYSWFEMVFDSLVEEIKFRIVGCFMDGQSRFVMNREMYKLFRSVAPRLKAHYWNGIHIEEDLTPEEYLLSNEDENPKGRILLEYREPVYIQIPEGIKAKTSITEKELESIFELTERRNTMPPRSFSVEFYCNIPKYLEIEKVIYNNPATIVLWNDGTKTVVQCQKGDDYDPEKGLAMAIAKKALGNTSRKLNDVLHKWEKKESTE